MYTYGRRALAVFITVGVDQGDDDPVNVVNDIGLGDLFDQLGDHVQSQCGGGPFPGVDSSIDDDDGLSAGSSCGGDDNSLQVATLARLAEGPDSHFAGVLGGEGVQVGVNL